MGTLRASSFRPSFSTASKNGISWNVDIFPGLDGNVILSSQTGFVGHGCFEEPHESESQLFGGYRGEICAADSHPGCAAFLIFLHTLLHVRHTLCESGGGSAGFSLGPFLPTTSAKPWPVRVSRCTLRPKRSSSSDCSMAFTSSFGAPSATLASMSKFRSESQAGPDTWVA